MRNDHPGPLFHNVGNPLTDTNGPIIFLVSHALLETKAFFRVPLY